MTAELLRRAAAHLRERAESATPGPWETFETLDAETFVSERGRRAFGVVSRPATGRGDYGANNARYIATMHPGVGLALAAWLENSAHHAESREANGMPADQSADPRPLAVARAVLGEAT